MTVLELIEDGARRLAGAGVAFGHGTANAFDESAWLVLWALGLPLDSNLDPGSPATRQAVAAPAAAKAEAIIRRRIESRQPAAYLTGEAWLCGVPFNVDSRTIVPRSFVAELLAGGAIDPWLGDHTGRVLDLCTGGGSLAVLAAMAWPDVTVDAADISADALAVARSNIDRHGLQDRIRLLISDSLRSVDGPYDLIVCNPPYVNAQSMARLPAEYQAEPPLALAGGADGMAFVGPLLRAAPQYMNANAVLVLEIGNERENFDAAFPRFEAVWLETSAGQDQVLLVTREALLLSATCHDHT